MKTPDLPSTEPARIAALCALEVLDTPSEARFDRVTRIAQRHFQVPIALVSLVDTGRQWFKSRQGLDAAETPRSISFCGHAILGEDIFLVPNALEDPRFADNPLVTGAPHIRFYAGAPLHAPGGERVGTLCIIDRRPRDFTAAELSVLRDLADGVEEELGRSLLLRDRAELAQTEGRLQQLVQVSPGVIYACKASGDFGATYVSEQVEAMLGYKPQAFTEDAAFWLEHVHPEDRDAMLEDLKRLFETGEHTHEYRFRHADGSYRWMHDKLRLVRDAQGGIAEIVGLWMDITSRKAAEEKAADTARLLDSVIENLPVMLFLKRASDLRMVLFNRAGEKMCGFGREQLIGRNDHDNFPKEEADFFALKDRQVLHETGFLDIPEEVITTRDGRQLTLHTSKVALKDAQGVPQYLLGISEDITERKRAEEALNRFKRVLDSTVDMIFMFDAETLQFVYLNDGAVRSMGYAHEELLRLHPYDIKPRMPEPQFRAFIAPLLAGKQDKLHFETVHRRKDGTEFPVEISLQLVREASERGRFVAIVRDITERKHTEAQMKAAETRIRAIVDNVVDGIITINERGIVTTLNPAAERIFGHAANEVIGRNVKMLMPEPYQSAHDGYLAAYLHGGEKKVIGIGREVTGRRKDGSTFPMDLAVSEMRVNGERMFSGIVRDITERKKVERMKDEFVSTVSHELRTPLTSIRGALSLLLGKHGAALPEKGRQLLEMAKRNSERLTLLINDILDLEKIESGSLDFEFKALDLAALAQQALAANEGYAHQHGVRLRLAEAPPAAQVWGDQHRLLQVFANLLSNAIKYSPRKGEVVVSVAPRDDRYRVSVRDRGKGIPAEFRSRVFQRFAQADSSDTREKGGTGLGLSVTKAIVERHGGTIDYASEIGAGTEFFFELPAWQETVTGAHGGEKRPLLLICEDNSEVARVLGELLASEGLSSDIAASAAGAKSLLAERRYQALLLDLSLPDQDGLALIRELRTQAHTKDLPIIVVSGRASEGRAAWQGEALAVVDWLQKPVDEARLAHAIRQALAGYARPRLLHVEDDPDVIQVVQALVAATAEYAYAATLAEARERLAAERFDLVLLDLMLPDGSGLALLEEFKGSVPIIVFSALESDRRLSEQVAATLVKTRTSNEHLLETIKRTLHQKRTASHE